MTPKQLLELDEKAADLYLEHWQLGEKPNNPNDIGYVGDEEVEQDNRRLQEIVKELTELGYPDPNTIVYDNEAEPLIQWKSRDFSYYKWLELRLDDEI